MADLVDLRLTLSDASARQQWRRIAEREWRPRQEPFLPIELLLCFGLFRVLNPHSFGGSNIDRLPDGVKRLALCLRRTPGSLTNKMLTLEGVQANGARHETALFLRLGQQPDRFATLYLMVLRAARLKASMRMTFRTWT